MRGRVVRIGGVPVGPERHRALVAAARSRPELRRGDARRHRARGRRMVARGLRRSAAGLGRGRRRDRPTGSGSATARLQHPGPRDRGRDRQPAARDRLGRRHGSTSSSCSAPACSRRHRTRWPRRSTCRRWPRPRCSTGSPRSCPTSRRSRCASWSRGSTRRWTRSSWRSRAVASVTLLSGILVLAGAVAAARRRHLYESVVLKVLGARRIDCSGSS